MERGGAFMQDFEFSNKSFSEAVLDCLICNIII